MVSVRALYKRVETSILTATLMNDPQTWYANLILINLSFLRPACTLFVPTLRLRVSIVRAWPETIIDAKAIEKHIEIRFKD